mgnify:CR=1 FL=1
MDYILLIIGFVLLIKGADFFVEGASELAALMRIPPILIGLTIVAFGTSAPEAAVSISAALYGSGDIAVGNVVGSNIVNITLIIGVAALLAPLKVERQTIRKEIPFALLASLAFLILASDTRLNSAGQSLLDRSDGLILLLLFAVFLYYIYEAARNSRENEDGQYPRPDPRALGRYVAFTIGGMLGIIFGGDLVVDSSVRIAYRLGMSETLVGLTIVAFGTSLPELITSVTAGLRKKSDIALGNIIGSNIFNIFFVLGAASVISPLKVDARVFTDSVVMIAATLILLIFSGTGKKVGRREGITLTAAYILYLVFILIRN